MTIQKIKSGRVNSITANEFVGEKGTIFYNEDTGELRLSDGHTLGGNSVIPVASPTTPGLVKIGAGITIGADGTISATSSGGGVSDYNQLTNKPFIPDLAAVAQNIIPTQDAVYSIGSPTARWKSLYISSQTLYIDTHAISINTNGELTVDGNPIGSTISYTELKNLPTLSTVAHTGDFNDLINKPAGSNPATKTALGVVKIGNNINILVDGTISVPVATSSIAGVVKPGTNILLSADGTIDIPKLDAAPGILAPNTAIVVDSNSKIDKINVGTITVTGLSNTISSTNTDGNIIISPNGVGYVQITGTNGVVIPVGNTAQQNPRIQGAIRFNTTTSQFEGYNGTDWTSMGGVRSVDGKAFIVAETAPGAGDDTIHIYSGSDGTSGQVGTWDKTNLHVLNTTQSTSTTTGALVVDGGVGIAKNLNVGGDLGLTGNVTSGTWKGNVIDTTYGGTNFSTYSAYDILVGDGSNNKLKKLAMGAAGKFLQVNSAGNALIYDDIDGGTY